VVYAKAQRRLGGGCYSRNPYSVAAGRTRDSPPLAKNLPPTPRNFVRIVDLNEAGDCPTSDPTELESGSQPVCGEVGVATFSIR
jgi:hypothetical protein